MPYLFLVFAIVVIVSISLGALSVKVTLLSLALKGMTFLLSGIGLLYVLQQFIVPLIKGRKP